MTAATLIEMSFYNKKMMEKAHTDYGVCFFSLEIDTNNKATR